MPGVRSPEANSQKPMGPECLHPKLESCVEPKNQRRVPEVGFSIFSGQRGQVCVCVSVCVWRERDKDRMKGIVQLFNELIFRCLPRGQEEPGSQKGTSCPLQSSFCTEGKRRAEPPRGAEEGPHRH